MSMPMPNLEFDLAHSSVELQRPWEAFCFRPDGRAGRAADWLQTASSCKVATKLRLRLRLIICKDSVQRGRSVGPSVKSVGEVSLSSARSFMVLVVGSRQSDRGPCAWLAGLDGRCTLAR